MAKQELTQEFSTTTVDKTTAFVEKNKQILIGIIAAIVIIVGGLYAYHVLVAEPNEEKASYLLSDKTDFNGFVNIAKKYSSTKAGNLANLYAGLCYAQKGDTKTAIKFLEEFKGQGDQMISPAAVAALGNCYAKAGDIDKAVSLLKEAAEKADNNTLSPLFLIQAGELLESQNKVDEALKLYQTAKDKYPVNAEAQQIDKYIQHATK